MRAVMMGMVLVVGASAADAAEPVKFQATLAGHAVLPAATAVAPPADAPAYLKVSGRFTGPDGRRVDTSASSTARPSCPPRRRRAIPASRLP